MTSTKCETLPKQNFTRPADKAGFHIIIYMVSQSCRYYLQLGETMWLLPNTFTSPA